MKQRRKPLPRPKTLPEFFEREEQFWQELLASWEGLPEEAFFQPGACGPEWTIKDTMNHILTWQEAALRILPMLARGEKAALGMGTERFNAQEYLRHKDVSLDETLRNLMATRRKLLDLIATLPESQVLDVDGRIGWWVKYNTYDHYAQHLYDLQTFRQTYQS